MKYRIIFILFIFCSCGHIMSEEEIKQYDDRKSKTQTAVSNWIKKHALYPKSYMANSFSEYSESFTQAKDGKIPNSENYVIKHEHRILDKDSNWATFSGYFILEYDYSISLIETQRSHGMGGGSVQEVQIWTNRFGRPTNKQDSIEQELHSKRAANKFINEMKSGLEKGTLYTEDEKDLVKLKNLIDTLEKK